MKVGGELIICVPNLTFAAKKLIEAENNPEADLMYTFWQLYGRNETGRPEEMHKCGFTKNGLRRLALMMHEYIQIDSIEETDDNCNLTLRCTKTASSKPHSITSDWAEFVKKTVPQNGTATSIKLLEPENGRDELFEVAAEEKS